MITFHVRTNVASTGTTTCSTVAVEFVTEKVPHLFSINVEPTKSSKKNRESITVK